MIPAEKNRLTQSKKIVSTDTIGVSFSVLACREYSIDWEDCLQDTLRIGHRRFRLMSYWSLHEPTADGGYDFTVLDKQLEILEKSQASATLSLGMRQPRWPETHIPDWAKVLTEEAREERYMQFHQAVIERYKDSQIIESWQLENEYWLRSFGRDGNFSRRRLKREFQMIRELDPGRPVIMSLAHVLSLPLRRPTPDLYATSVYRILYDNKKQRYTSTWAQPYVFAIKRALIRLIKHRELIIHELQTEPWGPKANWEMTIAEQDMSISPEQIQFAVAFAKKTGITYIDLWGAEWWYWRRIVQGDAEAQRIATAMVKSRAA